MAGVSGALWEFDRAGHRRAEHDGSYLGPDPAQRGESERVGLGPTRDEYSSAISGRRGQLPPAANVRAPAEKEIKILLKIQMPPWIV